MRASRPNVLVTGGSRGVGLAIATRLASAGYRVVAVARKTTPALDQAIADAPDGALQFAPFDLGKTDAIHDLVQKLKTEFGPFYGLVNNAALGTDGLLSNLHNSRIEELVRVNTLSPIILSKYMLRMMMNAGEGRIVNIASIAADHGASGLSAYAATKASMIGFTKSLAREAGRFNVTVNAVAPGYMETEMTESLGSEARAKLARRSALGRLVEVGDVAASVEFLLGPGARNITGTVLTIDTGTTA